MTAAGTIEQALAMHRSGDLEGARSVYAHILADHPDDAAALHLLGVVHFQRNDRAEAERCFRHALSLAPGYAAALGNLGLLLVEDGRLAEGLDQLRHALAIDPAQAAVWNNLGMALVRAERYDDAVAACREALTRAPESADTLCNLGNALRGAGNPAEALTSFEQSIARQPHAPEAWNGLGNVLADLDRPDDAVAAYEHALALRPAYLSALTNMGRTVRESGDLARAADIYRRAIALHPASAEAHWGLAFVLLLQGDLAAGWQEYAWRWRLPVPPDARSFPSPRWDGTPAPGTTLLLVCEQGLGDAIQFIRYARLLAGRGFHIVVEAPAELVRIVATVQGIERVIRRGDPLPPHAYHCHLLDLPALCVAPASALPATVPYLGVDAADRAAWGTRLAGEPAGLRVGLAWSGSTGHINDRRRSCGAGPMQILLNVHGAVFHSLQKDGSIPAAADAGTAHVVDHAFLLTDVMATAGLISHLDLVITVDTMVAHLAGALGKQVWLLLPFAPDWRWMAGRSDSPWYPGMRIFRQDRPGDWEGVVRAVAGELAVLTAERGGPAPARGDAGVILAEGLARHEAGDHAHAARLYRDVLAKDPDNADALYLFSVLCHQTGRSEEGVEAARKLLAARPEHAEGWNSLGNLLRDLRRTGDAVQAFREAVRLQPGYPEAWYNCGLALCDVPDPGEAGRCFEQALRLGAPRAQTLNNAGLVQYRSGRLADAVSTLRAAIAADPHLVEGHWNLAHALLHAGMYDEGWREFEWRWAKPEFRQLRSRHLGTAWDGRALPGRTILLWAEQGYGDALQFFRFIPAVAAMGMCVIVECPAPLHRIAAAIDGVAHVTTPGAAVPHHDVQCALMSLPSVVPALRVPAMAGAYLKADPAAVGHWEERLQAFGDRLRVGIVWEGSGTNPDGRYRSVPLETLGRLAGVPGTVFVSLQKGDGARAFAASAFARQGVDWTEELTDFAGTAALIAALDVVITIDTAVAHLAGALGRETWLLLSRPHDWRWGTEPDRAPWYRSIRTMRQQHHGVWTDVIDRCVTLLAERASFAGSVNAGVARIEEGTPRAAVRDLRRAVAMEPQHPLAHLNLAFALLGSGMWDEGFTEFEWRLQTPHGHAALRPYDAPRPTADTVAGKTVFVYAEQGFGDVLQFVRYARLLQERGARVVLECRREIAGLMRFVPGVDSVIVRGEAPPAFDLHTPLLSLPRVFGTTPATVPSQIPYVVLPGDLPDPAGLPAGSAGLLRVGIVWSGNPDAAIDGERSIALEDLLRPLPVKDVVYLALQMGPASAACRTYRGPHRVHDVSGSLHDFTDTASIIRRLDVVISVDTAVAHLAGAMGRPVITLLPVNADWRWLTGSDATPWYPTMRLARQSVRGRWDDVADRVAHCLRMTGGVS